MFLITNLARSTSLLSRMHASAKPNAALNKLGSICNAFANASFVLFKPMSPETRLCASPNNEAANAECVFNSVAACALSMASFRLPAAEYALTSPW